MTCIVGFVDRDTENVFIGGDSAGVAGNTMIRYAQPKVFRRGEFLIGYCGSYRYGNVLQHALEVPKQKRNQSDHEFMVMTFADAARDALGKAGALKKKDDVEDAIGAALIAYRGKLFEFFGDLQVGEPAEGYAAIGSGQDHALGALRVLRMVSGLDPNQRANAVLEAAAAHCPTVCGPFHVMSLIPGVPAASARAEKERAT